jgi:hypothetical protein
MKNRIKHFLYLAPAIFLGLIWIVAAPTLPKQIELWLIVLAAAATALTMAWCVTMFAHALQRDKS